MKTKEPNRLVREDFLKAFKAVLACENFFLFRFLCIFTYATKHKIFSLLILFIGPQCLFQYHHLPEGLESTHVLLVVVFLFLTDTPSAFGH